MKNGIKLISLPIFMFLLCCLQCQSAQEVSNKKSLGFSYGEIARIYLSCFSSAKKIKPTKLGECRKELSPDARRHIVFNLFATYHPNKLPSCSDIDTLNHDLHILAYQSKEKELREKSLLQQFVSMARTSFGEAVLARIITDPILDVSVLRKRQAFIKTLMNPEQGHLDAEIRKFQEAYVNELLFCFVEPHKAEANMIKGLYFSTSWFVGLNNEYVLGGCSRICDMAVIVPWLIEKVVANGQISLVTPDKKNDLDVLSARKKLLNNNLSVVPNFRWGSDLRRMYSLMGEDIDMSEFAETLLNVSSGLEDCVALYTLAGRIYDRYAHHKNNITFIHARMNACSALIRLVDYIENTAKTCPELQVAIDAWKQRFKHHSPEFERLLALLRTNTFTGSPSYFSRLGRVQEAYYLFQKTKQEFAPYMELVGIVDAHYAIGKHLQASKHTSVPYAFADYREQDTPYCVISDLRNPLLAHKEGVVGNDITLGDGTSAPRGAIVTGSNTAGKSTIMVTGLASAIHLAETMTTTPVAKMEITPMAIATASKVTDNVYEGRSHAQAEKDQRNKVLALVAENSTKNRKTLVVADELFEGFAPEIGNKAIWQFGKKLSEDPNTIFVISTHFRNPITQLEGETNGICKNYRVDVKVTTGPDGKLIIERPHKVEPGISNVNIGDALLEGYGDIADELTQGENSPV